MWELYICRAAASLLSQKNILHQVVAEMTSNFNIKQHTNKISAQSITDVLTIEDLPGLCGGVHPSMYLPVAEPSP